MRKKLTRALGSVGIPKDFTAQNLIKDPDQEICTFYDKDIQALKKSRAFPDSAVFRPFDLNAKSDFASYVWVCFFFLPF